MRRNDPCPKLKSGAAKGPDEAGPLPEECAAFLRQIGSPEVFPEGLAEEILPGGVRDEGELRAFLMAYQRRFLIPLEIPAITQARYHAACGHARELIALDEELSAKPMWPAFASASQRIGRIQLKGLRPLRDERTVQRYLAAVQAGKAAGWHTVVYGLTLAVYSWPLRHGLVTYGRETLMALASAARPIGLPESACVEILNPLLVQLPEAIERALAFMPSDAATKKAGPLRAEPSGLKR